MSLNGYNAMYQDNSSGYPHIVNAQEHDKNNKPIIDDSNPMLMVAILNSKMAAIGRSEIGELHVFKTLEAFLSKSGQTTYFS